MPGRQSRCFFSLDDAGRPTNDWSAHAKDIDGEPTLRIDQRKLGGSMTLARATFTRHLFFLGNCRRFVLRWRLASRFGGPGSYSVRLQVRDDDGALSNVVARTIVRR